MYDIMWNKGLSTQKNTKGHIYSRQLLFYNSSISLCPQLLMCRNRTGSKKINRSSEVVKETLEGTEHWSLHPLPWAPGKLCNLKKLTVRFLEILILKSGLLIARGRVLSREGLETSWSISHLSFFLHQWQKQARNLSGYQRSSAMKKFHAEGKGFIH